MKRLLLYQHYPDEVHSWSRVATASGEDGDIRDRLVKLKLGAPGSVSFFWNATWDSVAEGKL